MIKMPIVANDNLESIELEFDCSRSEFCQNAELICEAIPDDAPLSLFECVDCGKPHLRIELPPGYTARFADRLEIKGRHDSQSWHRYQRQRQLKEPRI